MTEKRKTFKQIAVAWILLIKVQCVICQWISLNELYKLPNGKLFTNFKLVFESLAENQKIFKRILMREYWWKCNALYINGFDLTRSTKLWKAFFLILESYFELRGPTPFEDMIFYLWTDSNEICTAYVKLKINHILFVKNFWFSI